MRILVVNAGSSSLKLRVLDGDDLVASADLPGSADAAAIRESVPSLANRGFGVVDVAGHRIVHGGTVYRGPVRIDAEVRRRLGELTDLAPLHQPPALAALDAVSSIMPDVPAVACFDTAFHATIPDAASTYALPSEWRERWSVRKFGFHGLSHAYIARRVASLTGRDDLRIVSCHLGAGASLCAIANGRSVETTMGFTPLDGLVMATRSGSVDPGLVLWLVTDAKMPAAEVSQSLEGRSGLAGLAGTSDMREVLSRASSGDADAVLARDVYLHRLRGLIGSMAAALGGLDVLVFTGGVGENSEEIRRRAMDGLGFLGVHYSPADGNGDREISPATAAVRAFVIEAREDLEISREINELLSPR
jgi:acetate kinase